MNPGAQPEQKAARYLQQQGLQLEQANYRCRFGEIDLILHEGKTLVFAEVRLRSRSDFGGVAASIQYRCTQTGQADPYHTTLPCQSAAHPLCAAAGFAGWSRGHRVD